MYIPMLYTYVYAITTDRRMLPCKPCSQSRTEPTPFPDALKVTQSMLFVLLDVVGVENGTKKVHIMKEREKERNKANVDGKEFIR